MCDIPAGKCKSWKLHCAARDNDPDWVAQRRTIKNEKLAKRSNVAVKDGSAAMHTLPVQQTASFISDQSFSSQIGVATMCTSHTLQAGPAFQQTVKPGFLYFGTFKLNATLSAPPQPVSDGGVCVNDIQHSKYKLAKTGIDIRTCLGKHPKISAIFSHEN